MAYNNRPHVRRGVLTTSTATISLDSAAWFDWLVSAEYFCYWGDDCRRRLTIRKEQRRNSFYWYAYLKKNCKLHNAYLGTSARLSHAFLEQVASQLVQKAYGTRQHDG